jgi:hypothetical protein
VGAILVGAAIGSQDAAVVAFTCASVAGYAVYLLAIGFVGGVDPVRISTALAGPAVLSGCCALTTWAFDLSGVGKYASIVVFGIGWAGGVYRTYKIFRSQELY